MPCDNDNAEELASKLLKYEMSYMDYKAAYEKTLPSRYISTLMCTRCWHNIYIRNAMGFIQLHS